MTIKNTSYRNNYKSRYRNFLIRILIISLIAGVCLYLFMFDRLIPDGLNVNTYSSTQLRVGIPFIGTIVDEENSEVLSSSATSVYIGFQSGETGVHNFEFKLFGRVPLKKLRLNVVNQDYLIPCGNPVGVYLKTDGVMVVSTDCVGDDEAMNPSEDILFPGDYITEIDGERIKDKISFSELIDSKMKAGKAGIYLTVRRNNKESVEWIVPVMDERGVYKIGAWIRDDCQGLGTLTYVDMDGNFGALGHKVSDTDTGKMVVSEGGILYKAKVWNIVKGESGNPGEVVGSIYYDESNRVGDIAYNSEIGIYGKVSDSFKNSLDSPIPIGHKQDVRKDKAYIRSFVSGEIEDYEIEIVAADISDSNINKGITFKVTDKRLLEITGGIVQGMSGSPILQDGKIIGAVTHVLINDPTKGYGIFIESMIKN